jgi:hypothetical protein
MKSLLTLLTPLLLLPSPAFSDPLVPLTSLTVSCEETVSMREKFHWFTSDVSCLVDTSFRDTGAQEVLACHFRIDESFQRKSEDEWAGEAPPQLTSNCGIRQPDPIGSAALFMSTPFTNTNRHGGLIPGATFWIQAPKATDMQLCVVLANYPVSCGKWRHPSEDEKRLDTSLQQ